MRFTDAKIRTLKARSERYEIIEDGSTGLAVRVSQRGVKTFSFLYRFDGKPRRLTLGVYRDPDIDVAGNGSSHDMRGLPYLTLADARVSLAQARKLRDSGVDPASQAVESHADAREARANTVQAVADRYFANIGAADGEPDSQPKRRGRRGKVLRTAKDVKRTLERFFLSRFGERPIGDVTRRELIKLFDDLADENGPIAANRALAWTKRLFKWSVSKGYIDANPAADIEKPGEERKGTRVLSDGELLEVWAASGALGYPYGHFTKALLLTGRRSGQVANMQHGQIDAAARVWTPIEGAANKLAPELPTSKAFENLIADCRSVAPPIDTDDHVFVGIRQERAGDTIRTVRTGPVNSLGQLKRQLDATILAARRRAAAEAGADVDRVTPMPEWDLSRDIRRTVKTRLAELGVEKDIRDLVMGHARQGMDAVYDHSRRREQKREAMERWAMHLQGIVSPSATDNVARLSEKREAAR